MKNCPQCGAPISKGDSVCRYCGRKFESDVDHSRNSGTSKGKEERNENRPISNISQQARIHLSNRYELKKKNVFSRIVIGFIVTVILLCLLSALL